MPHFNEILRPFLNWCLENDIQLKPNWVKSEEMLADGLSRWAYDTWDYTLSQQIFGTLQKIYSKIGFQPTVDMFASPGNAKLEKFVSRWPHFQALAVNALETSLEKNLFASVYANPPWNLILPWLNRLRKNPQVTCLATIPYWVRTV